MNKPTIKQKNQTNTEKIAFLLLEFFMISFNKIMIIISKGEFNCNNKKQFFCSMLHKS